MALYSTYQIALLEGVQTDRCWSLVAFTILYFDYITMLPTEIQRFWSEFTWSWASALFVFNRYLSIIGPVPVMLEYFGDISEIRSRRLQSFHQYYAVLTQTTIGAVLLIRTYALYNKSQRILTLLVGAVVVAAVISVWLILSEGRFTEKTESLIHLLGCDMSLTDQQGRRLTGAWSSMLVFDTLVFVLTALRAVQSNGLWRGGLLRLMVLDGAAYYGLIVIANIANIVTFVVTVPTAKGTCVSLTNVISSTLISRIMLNIRDPERRVLKDCRISLDEITLDASAPARTHSVSKDFEDVMIIA